MRRLSQYMGNWVAKYETLNNRSILSMSLYNMMYGANPATFYILPMLGKHPDEYPRFRDCFLEKDSLEFGESPIICVYTRTGGPNREDYLAENSILVNDKNYLDNYDDDNDCTYAIFRFSVPLKWRPDFDKIVNGKFDEVSNDYRDQVKRVYPKLAAKIESQMFKEVHDE